MAKKKKKTQTDDFDLLHNFVHDLKTPLSAVKSFVELIEHSGELNERQRRFCDQAQSGLDRMQRIIDELLDFARMEADMEFNIEVVDLKQLVEENVSFLGGMAEDKKVVVNAEVPPTAQFAHADKRMISHVIANLLSNAIKYNRISGEIVVSAESNEDYVQVNVRDTGLGIPEDDQPHVFEKFYRVNARDRRKIEGTGLGLAIVKGVVERHGGQVGMESIEGEGSTFYFTLPRANTSSPDHDREPPDDMDDRMQEIREELEDSDAHELY
jgi:signal transduction histidine kinase